MSEEHSTETSDTSAEQQQSAETTQDQGQSQQTETSSDGVEQQTQQTETKPAPKTDWKDRRIAQQGERLRNLQREIEELKSVQQQSSGGKPLDPNLDFERRVQEAAYQQAQGIAAQQAFNARVNDAYQAGLKTFGDFDQKVAALKGVVDWSDPVQQQAYNQFLIASLETGEAPRLIHALGSDPSEASRVLALPAVRMAIELAKMASAEPTQVSGAPKPIIPITQTASNRTQIKPDDPDRADQLSTQEWIRRRNEQADALHRTRFGR